MQPLPEKIYPIAYGGYWTISANGRYDDPDLWDEKAYPDAKRLFKEIAERYNNYPKLLAELETLKNKIS